MRPRCTITSCAMRGTVCARRQASSPQRLSRSSHALGDTRGRRRRSADPDPHVALAARKPAPAAVIAVIGINAECAKAAAEMCNMMEAADTMEVTNAAETGMDGTGTVEAGMDAVAAAVTTAMSAAMTTAMSAAMTA